MTIQIGHDVIDFLELFLGDFPANRKLSDLFFQGFYEVVYGVLVTIERLY
jgi:hypothetical protein